MYIKYIKSMFSLILGTQDKQTGIIIDAKQCIQYLK